MRLVGAAVPRQRERAHGAAALGPGGDKIRPRREFRFFYVPTMENSAGDCFGCWTHSLSHFRDSPCAHRPATFPDRESHALLHGRGVNQLHVHLQVVARHRHLHAVWQRHVARDVRRPEEELRAIARHEWRVAPALVLCERENLSREFVARLDRTRSADDL